MSKFKQWFFESNFGTMVPEKDATSLIAKLRGGDKRSKNQGWVSKETPTGNLVYSKIPVDLFDNEYIDFIKNSTNPERVMDYEKSMIKTPIYVLLNKKGRPIISDGGHRFMASINRGEKWINALVPLKLHNQIHGDSGKSF